MPDQSQTSPSAFVCEGGLIKSRSTFIMQPGQALELLNFEPDIEGGYRRINGFRKHVNHIVPQTSASSEKVLMVAFFNNNIVAARGQKIFSSASTELATAITSSATMSGSGTITVDSTTGFSSSGTLQIDSEIFTYTGVTSTTFTGVTRATVFNTSFSATDVTESTVEGAKFVTAFKSHMFYAGMSSTPQTLVFSQPFDEDAFNSGSGAGSIKVDDTIVGMKAFRGDLFVFCENRIFKLTGSSSSDFAITPVTRNIGCINGDTIQEFAGDLIFLGPDGLRTVAGTARIGDVELGTISANVQSIFDENLVDAALFESVVIPDKTQYRIFFAKDGQGEDNTRGVICVMKGQNFEFAELKGIKPSATDTFVEAGDVLVLHGGYDGYIHRQEKGNDFDGTKVSGRYRSPDLTFGDPGIRKHMQRVIVNYKPESAINADMFVRYDYEDRNSSRPAAYPLDSEDVVAIYGTSTYGTPTYGGASQPLLRQSVEGSGFAVALRVNDNATTAPYSLKGFQLEYQLGARR
jgi:hypothetical protein